MTRKKNDDYDKITKIRINGKLWEVQAYHPAYFKDDVYLVRFHEYGQLYLERYSKYAAVRSPNRVAAIRIARMKLFGR